MILLTQYYGLSVFVTAFWNDSFILCFHCSTYFEWLRSFSCLWTSKIISMGNISSHCQTLNKETISFNRISGTVIYNQVNCSFQKTGRFYNFFKKNFVVQEAIDLNISWPGICSRIYFMAPPINFSFLVKAFLQQYFKVVLTVIFKFKITEEVNIHNNNIFKIQ